MSACAPQEPAQRDVAEKLAAMAGLGRVENLRPLAFGRNNQGFVLTSAGGPRSFLKIYFSHPGDSRDRLGAESAFAHFARDIGETRGPRPLAVCRERNAILFEFISGRPPRPDEVGERLIAEAADFFAAINLRRDDPRAKALPEASEACFTVPAHLRLIDSRVARLAAVPASDEPARALARFVSGLLRPAWASVRERTLRRAAGEAADAAAWCSRCLSPSDFGFHNALIEHGGRVRFLDFEYAGQDDPAKTICDFFLQPAIAAPREHAGAFARRIGEALDAGSLPAARARLLFPAYAVKWACILLNEFVRVDARRRSFAQGGAGGQEGRTAQLDKAEALLRTIDTLDLNI